MTLDPIDLLQQLVRIPSLNPDGVDDPTITSEQNIAEFLADLFTKLGAEVQLDEIRPGRPNFIARFAPRDGRPRILFGPHLDTVSIEGMTIDPFAAEIRDGKLWGRGTSDTKGPMSAMICALASRAELLKNSPVAIDFVGFMDEESGQTGARAFAEQYGSEYIFAFAGEPTDLNFVNVTKGSFRATLEAEGKATHSSQPELGDNAIVKIARTAELLHSEFSEILAGFPHPVLGHSTINPAIIRGGSRFNIVPDHAELDIDVRVTPALASGNGGARGELERFLAQHCPETKIKQSTENPPMEVSPEHPVLQRCLLASPGSSCVGAPWFSDAAHLNAAGIPAVCAGPGSIDQAHTKDEFIRISDLQAGVPFFQSLIDTLATAEL